MKIVMNVIALILGVIIGAAVNMLIVSNGSALIPFPDGYDMTDMESMKLTMNLLSPKNYIIPWLAHAVGTLVGAVVTFNLAKSNQFYLALVVCIVFLTGGIMMVVALPSPMWFNGLDLGLAYLPMAWIVQRFFSFRKEN